MLVHSLVERVEELYLIRVEPVLDHTLSGCTTLFIMHPQALGPSLALEKFQRNPKPSGR
jgi:hypothetical protein